MAFTPLNVQKPAPAPSKPGLVGSLLSGAKDFMGALEKPFVDVAAIPAQGVAKLVGAPDPFTKGIGGGEPPVKVNPVTDIPGKIGSAGEVASYMIPYGRFAKLGRLGRIAAGAATGYATDVASNLANNSKKPFSPGFGTVLGALIPGGGTAGKAAGRIAGESLGVTTGAGYGAIKQAFTAAEAGGKQAKEYVDALRGNTSPEQIVNEARGALQDILTQRRTAYQTQLEKIAADKTSLDVSPIITTLQDQLTKFKIAVKNGVLDFSQSAIRFDKEAQKDVQTIYEEMKTYGTQKGDRTAVGVDSLKQALQDLYSKSSNVRSLVQSVAKSTRKVLAQVPGYDKLAGDYASKTELIADIQKALSLGDKSAVDTAFRKLVSALRLNNDFRKEMIAELDKASGGALSSKIAGQQMSEVLPRGIMRPLEGMTALGAAASGYLLPLLKFAAVASPRVVGEIINALGISSRAAKAALQAIGGTPTLQAGVAPATQLVKGSIPQASSSLEAAGNPAAQGGFRPLRLGTEGAPQN